MVEDSGSWDAGEEPSVLGAAPTLPFRRETRAERAERRREERRREAEREAARANGGDPVEPRRAQEAPPTPAGPPAGVGLREYSDIEYVFEPHSSSMPPLRPYLRGVWERRSFIRELARAELQRTRANTVLGNLWGVLDPLILSSIYILVFTIIREGRRPTDFIPLLIAGVMLFQFATTAMNEGANSITGSQNLILNSTFPRAVLPMSVLYKGLVKFIPVLGVYPFVFVIMDGTASWGMLLLPLLFAIQCVLVLGLAMLFATLVVYFRDVKNLLTYIVRMIFFTSPIIFPLEFIPDGIRAVLQWQPFFALFASYQTILGAQPVEWGWILQAAAWASGFLLVGGWVFLRRERDFANHL